MRSTIVDDLVSVVIPVFNRSGMLREAISSVESQTWKSFEIIVVDDGSDDGTAGLLDELGKKHKHITVLRQENSGPGAARELGRMYCRGSFIQYLDSDDLLLPDKFQHQIRILEENPDADVCYGKTALQHAGSEVQWEAWKHTGEALKSIFPVFLTDRAWVTSSPLFRRHLIDKAGPWPALRIHEDWVYDAQLGAVGASLAYLDEFVSITRRHSQNTTLDNMQGSFMADRAQAQRMIWDLAVTAGIDQDTPEVRTFSASVFTLARQCDGAGVKSAATDLLELSAELFQNGSREQILLRIYQLLRSVLGGVAASGLTEYMYGRGLVPGK